MGHPQRVSQITPEEYLARELDASEKHEYYQGEIFAMAGGSAKHSRIIANTIRAVGNKLVGTPCSVFDSNLRIRVPRSTLYTYPDVSVICGPVQFDPLDRREETVINPSVLIEVLSPSTEAWDRGGKFESYRQIDTLRQYVLIATEAPRVETFLRQADGSWIYTAIAGIELTARLAALGVDLPLADVFAGVDFSTPIGEAPPAA